MPTSLKVYSAPTNNNPYRAIVSVPSSVQLDIDIPTISLSQEQDISNIETELVAELSDLSDINSNLVGIETGYSVTRVQSNAGLFSATIPMRSVTIDANKNVSSISVLPSTKSMSAVLDTSSNLVLPTIEVETVQIPVGYVPVENLSSLENYSYNISNNLINGELKPLAVTQLGPENIAYSLQLQGNKIQIEGSPFVDSVRVDWININRNDKQRDWTTLGIFSFGEDVSSFVTKTEWNKSGEFLIRAIPYHKGYPLSGYKTYKHNYFTGSQETLWSFIQVDANKYILRLEGKLNEPVDYVKIKENNKLLFSGLVKPNNDGFVSRQFELNDVSDSEIPYITVEWYRKIADASIGYHYEQKIQMSKNRAKEDIELTVYKAPGSDVYQMSLLDLSRKMYQPSSEINPFSGTEWDLAIRDKKIMTYIEIRRHQNGDFINYGYYPLNITQDGNPKFLEGAPFKLVTRNSNGITFTWEDTESFRQLINARKPIENLPISYEFRLLFWTCGIEQSVRSNEEYIYLETNSFQLPDRVATHSHAYNTWNLEHPRTVYHKVYPDKLQDSLNSHVTYGRSQKAIVISTDVALENKNGTEFTIEPLKWQVLYQIDTIEDDIKEFPFYSFNIRIPTETQDNIQYVCVYLFSTDGEVKLGQYHPVNAINIIDFLGHYKEMKSTTRNIDMSHLFQKIYLNTPIHYRNSMAENDFRSLSVVPIKKPAFTTKQRTLNKKNLKAIANKAVMEKTKEKKINYRVEVTFSDGSTKSANLSADTKNIPSIPLELESNVSFSMGNPTLFPSAMNITSEYSSNLQHAIANAPLQNETFIESTSMIKTSADNFGVFR